MKTKHIVSLPGDGIGPEVTRVALQILQDVCIHHGVQLEITEHAIGGSSLDKYRQPITQKVLEACKKADAVFLGAVGGPDWHHYSGDQRPEAGLLSLRLHLGVFANLRPIRVYAPLVNASSLKPAVVQDVDILIVRELTGGIYFSSPRYTDTENGAARAVDTLEYNTKEVERLAQKGFEIASKRGRKIHSVDKANVLESSRLWRKTVDNMGNDWPDVELEHILVDNCAMQLVRDPAQFDVMITSNMFGDILSDEAAMLTGSIGMLPSASLGAGPSLYEPVHGSAPDIAGDGKANPLAAIASAALLCRYTLNLNDAAQQIELAIEATLDEGGRTADIYTGSANEYLISTDEMGAATSKHINSNLHHDSLT